MKIKKCTSLFLAVLVLVSNVGLAFNVHYCGGTVAGISPIYGIENTFDAQSVPEKKSCCGKPISEKKSCCDNKVIKVKEKSDSVFKTFSFQIATPFVIESWNPVIFTAISEITQPQITAYYCDAHAPPLYELFSQRLFYA